MDTFKATRAITNPSRSFNWDESIKILIPPEAGAAATYIVKRISYESE